MTNRGLRAAAIIEAVPEQLCVLLEAALQAWDAGQQKEACSLLQQAVPLAGQMGYL